MRPAHNYGHQPQSRPPSLGLALLALVGFAVVLVGVCWGTYAGLDWLLDRPGEEQAASASAPSPVSGGGSQVPTSDPQPAPLQEDRWMNVMGHVYAGTKVYWRGSPDQEPDLWFTVIEPYIEGDDGPLMLVEYAATGRRELVDRHSIIRSPAALAGQLVTERR